MAATCHAATFRSMGESISRTCLFGPNGIAPLAPQRFGIKNISRAWKRGGVSLQYIGRGRNQHLMPNITPERAYNPFPREGLVKAFEPFIRKEANRYCESYPHVPRIDLLIEAVRLATQAEATFKPALGNSFSTHVAYRLKQLHRFAEGYAGMRIKVESAEEKAVRLALERGEDPRPIAFKGGNAGRLIFDWQWTVGGWHALYHRFRVVFGMQTYAAMNAVGLADRLQEARSVLRVRPDQQLTGIFAAIADHLFRRQREADHEAEKQALGDYSPTLLEAERVTDVQFPGARQPPKFAPEYLPIISLDDAVGLDEDGGALKYHDVIAAPERQSVPEVTAIEAINSERQFMSRVENIAADVAVETIRGKPYDLSSLADKLGMTKGWTSKVWSRMLTKVSRK